MIAYGVTRTQWAKTVGYYQGTIMMPKALVMIILSYVIQSDMRTGTMRILKSLFHYAHHETEIR